MSILDRICFNVLVSILVSAFWIRISFRVLVSILISAFCNRICFFTVLRLSLPVGRSEFVYMAKQCPHHLRHSTWITVSVYLFWLIDSPLTICPGIHHWGSEVSYLIESAFWLVDYALISPLIGRIYANGLIRKLVTAAQWSVPTLIVIPHSRLISSSIVQPALIICPGTLYVKLIRKGSRMDIGLLPFL